MRESKYVFDIVANTNKFTMRRGVEGGCTVFNGGDCDGIKLLVILMRTTNYRIAQRVQRKRRQHAILSVFNLQKACKGFDWLAVKENEERGYPG